MQYPTLPNLDVTFASVTDRVEAPLIKIVYIFVSFTMRRSHKHCFPSQVQAKDRIFRMKLATGSIFHLAQHTRTTAVVVGLIC